MRLADMIQTTQNRSFSATVPAGYIFFIEKINTMAFNPPYLAKKFIEITPSGSFFRILIDGEEILETVPVEEEIICDGLCFRDKPNSLALEALPLSVDTKLLTEIRDSLTIQKPVGEVYDMTIDLTGNTVYELDETDNGDDLDWTSCTVKNKGPGPLYLSVNKWMRPKDPLAVGESIEIDLGTRGSIKKIYLVSEAEQTTSVRIQALR